MHNCCAERLTDSEKLVPGMMITRWHNIQRFVLLMYMHYIYFHSYRSVFFMIIVIIRDYVFHK